MSRSFSVVLLSLFAVIGCNRAPDSSIPSPDQSDRSPSNPTEEDPFFAHSVYWVSTSSEPQPDDTTIEVERLTLNQDPQSAPIADFVEHLASIGFPLRFDGEAREWLTTEPVAGSYVIRINIGAFPENSSLREMQRSLAALNLAFGLNPDAHLAMSIPSLVRLTPSPSDLQELKDALASERFQVARDRLKQAFLEYDP